MSDYAAKAARAGALIRRNGNGLQVTLTQTVITTDSAGNASGSTTQTGAFDAIVLPFQAPASESFQSVLLLRESHRKLLLAADTAPFVPIPGAIVRVEGADWRIAPGFTPLRPDGTTDVLYTATLER